MSGMPPRHDNSTSIFAATLFCAAAIAIAGCSSGNSPYRLASWLNLGKPNLTSFVGIRFGASLDRVREELPDGDYETAPYGANTWKVREVEAGGVRYPAVVFEFTDNMGMQLAIASFSASDGDRVLAQLTKAFGTPTHQRSGPGNGSNALIAVWELPHTERVTFDGPALEVEMLGPAGSTLKHDLAVRRAEHSGTE